MRSGYGVGLVVFLSPVLEVGISAFPYQISSARWRFVASGLISNAATLGLLGIAMLMITAAVLGHRVVLRVLSVATYGFSVALVVALGLYVLDGMELRYAVSPEAAGRFDLAFVKTVGLLGFLSLVGTWVATGAWKTSGSGRVTQSDSTYLGAGLFPSSSSRTVTAQPSSEPPNSVEA